MADPGSSDPGRRSRAPGGTGRDQPWDGEQPTTALPREPGGRRPPNPGPDPATANPHDRPPPAPATQGSSGEYRTDEIPRHPADPRPTDPRQVGSSLPPPDYWYERPDPPVRRRAPQGRDQRDEPYDQYQDDPRDRDRRRRPHDRGIRYDDRTYPQERYPDERYSDERYDRRYPDERAYRRYPDDPYDRRYADDRYDRGYPDERYDRRYPDERAYRPARRGHPGAEYLDAGDGYLDEPGTELEPAPRHQPVPRGSHLPPYQEPLAVVPKQPADRGPLPPGTPRKLTVTRVAALRSKQLTQQGVQLFRRATTADGADRSGLTHLTYAVMANYAADAALAIALANTLFFAAATAESTDKVLLYLLITVAPFAIIAPLIGPLLDRLQSGRRFALAASFFIRAVLAVIMVFEFNSWVLYPCALGMLVLSKSFGVLKAALTPRVLPDEITLVKTNSRLTVFGLIAGGVAGAFAAALAWMAGSGGALVLTSFIAVAGGVLCLRIPSWVESTEGEVSVGNTGIFQRRVPFPMPVSATLWCNGTIRVETGFLALFIAFVVKSQFAHASAFDQLLLLGVVGAAAGLGGFVGNALGARLPLNHPETMSLYSLVAVICACLVAVLAPGMVTATIVALIGSTASSLAKVCLDSVIQRDLPEVSRASAFGRSETALQLSWVFGGVLGLMIGGVWKFGSASVYAIGFGVVTFLLALGLAQCLIVRRNRTLVPKLRFLHRTPRPGTTPPPTGPAGPSPSQSSRPADRPPPRVAGAPDKPKKAPRKAGGPR